MSAYHGQHAEDRLMAIIHGDDVDPANSDMFNHPPEDPFSLAKTSDVPTDARKMQGGDDSHWHYQMSQLSSPDTFDAELWSESSVDNSSGYSKNELYRGIGALPFSPYGFGGRRGYAPILLPQGSSLASDSATDLSLDNQDPLMRRTTYVISLPPQLILISLNCQQKGMSPLQEDQGM